MNTCSNSSCGRKKRFNVWIRLLFMYFYQMHCVPGHPIRMRRVHLTQLKVSGLLEFGTDLDCNFKIIKDCWSQKMQKSFGNCIAELTAGSRSPVNTPTPLASKHGARLCSSRQLCFCPWVPPRHDHLCGYICADTVFSDFNSFQKPKSSFPKL